MDSGKKRPENQIIWTPFHKFYLLIDWIGVTFFFYRGIRYPNCLKKSSKIVYKYLWQGVESAYLNEMNFDTLEAIFLIHTYFTLKV